MKRVLVCVINNWPYLHSYFVESFANLIAYTRENAHHTDVHCDFRFVWGAYIDVMRNSSVTLATRGQYDYLMMLDADMIYPKETIIQSVGHNKDVVCGLYYWKTLKPYKGRGGAGYAPHAYKEYDENIFKEAPQWVSLNLSEQGGPLVQVDGLGGGGLCIKREVLEKVGSPQFECQWGEHGISGEDLNFCKKARSKGFKLYCDKSLKFGHITQSVVSDGKLMDLQAYASYNSGSFPGMAVEDVILKKGKPERKVTCEDIDMIMEDVRKKRFVGTIKQTKGGQKNAKTKNSKTKL